MLLPAAPIRYRRGDSEYRYRPDPELRYLSGHDGPGALLVVQGGEAGGRTVLFAPPRDPDEERWSGPREDPEALAERLGLDEGLPMDRLAGDLPGLTAKATHLHLRWGGDPRVDALAQDLLRGGRRRGPRTGGGVRGVSDPGGILDPLRLRKSPEEVERLTHATRLTTRGFREAFQVVAPGRGEWEVEATLEAAFRRGGGEGAAFASIVASGSRATTLHYTANLRRMEAGELLLVDAGAEWGGYAGDVTRCVPVTGRFAPAQEALYQVVAGALRAGVEAVSPGAPVDAPHGAVVRALCRGLVDLEILGGDPEEVEATGRYKLCFPHQTSHWLGMEVHDVGDYMMGGAPVPLEPGMVLTVEPGIYIPVDPREPEGSGRGWESFRGMGVRLEDDVLVTETGRRNLTEDLPLDPREVEELLLSGALP